MSGGSTGIDILDQGINGITQATTLGQAKFGSDGFNVKGKTINPLDAAVQLSTLGFAGYDGKTGKLKTGVQADVLKNTAGKPLMEGVKEITGANAAEEANRLAKDQFDQSTEDALKGRQNSLLQDQRNQIAASQGATAARGKKATTNKTVTPLGDTTDFLGL